jgi:uncharacterized protein YbjT (DUF2867 family)
MEPHATTVLLAGSTGLVGKEILSLVNADARISEIRVLTRRTPQKPQLSNKMRILVTDYSDLEENPDWFNVDIVFCALGTTMKNAGSKKVFRQVDFEYPLRVAKLAKAAGARGFVLVSAAGANPNSIFFYNRVKGEVEDAIRMLGFDRFVVVRPSLLLGDRGEFRPAERLASLFSGLAPRAWKPVHAKQVARGVIESGLGGDNGGHMIVDNSRLHQLS